MNRPDTETRVTVSGAAVINNRQETDMTKAANRSRWSLDMCDAGGYTVGCSELNHYVWFEDYDDAVAALAIANGQVLP